MYSCEMYMRVFREEEEKREGDRDKDRQRERKRDLMPKCDAWSSKKPMFC